MRFTVMSLLLYQSLPVSSIFSRTWDTNIQISKCQSIQIIKHTNILLNKHPHTQYMLMDKLDILVGDIFLSFMGNISNRSLWWLSKPWRRSRGTSWSALSSSTSVSSSSSVPLGQPTAQREGEETQVDFQKNREIQTLSLFKISSRLCKPSLGI